MYVFVKKAVRRDCFMFKGLSNILPGYVHMFYFLLNSIGPALYRLNKLYFLCAMKISSTLACLFICWHEF